MHSRDRLGARGAKNHTGPGARKAGLGKRKVSRVSDAFPRARGPDHGARGPFRRLRLLPCRAPTGILAAASWPRTSTGTRSECYMAAHPVRVLCGNSRPRSPTVSTPRCRPHDTRGAVPLYARGASKCFLFCYVSGLSLQTRSVRSSSITH